VNGPMLAGGSHGVTHLTLSFIHLSTDSLDVTLYTAIFKLFCSSILFILFTE